MKIYIFGVKIQTWMQNSTILMDFWLKILINRSETFCQRAIFELKYVFSHHCVDLPPESPKQALALAFLAQIMALTMEVKPYSSLLSFHNA